MAITGGLGQAVPESTTSYDPATGLAVKVTSPTGGTITKAFDKLGRQISYTDADGGVTTTEYDLLNRPVKVSDNVPSTVTLTYDHAAEPRGLVTKTTDSIAGVFQATYDADGSVATEKLPGGYTLTQNEDTTGSATERTYTRDSDGVIVVSDTTTESVHGQVTRHAGWSDQTYGYDATGRLTTVEDTADTICTKRTYTFDNRTNRKTRNTAASTPPAPTAPPPEAPPPPIPTTAPTGSSTPATPTTTSAAPPPCRAAPSATTPTTWPTRSPLAPSARPGSSTPTSNASDPSRPKPEAAPPGPRPDPRPTTTTATATTPAGSPRTPPPAR